jgi:hypothetical protein
MGCMFRFFSGRRAGAVYRVSYTYSKAFDNDGRVFLQFSIDNYNIWKDYGRSDDDQRHRLVFNGAIHTPAGNPGNFWERVSHGFELSGMVQYYSALPFNVTAGVNTIQGTQARPTVNGEFIGRNVGEGFNYFNVNARLSRTFRLSDRSRMEATLESFNLFNHCERDRDEWSIWDGDVSNVPASNF